MNKIRYIGAAIVLAVAGIAVGHQFADAAIPDSVTGEITACLNDDHAVRIIDAENGAVCNGSETTLSWLANGGTAYADENAGPITLTGGVNVASVNLPAGNFTLTAEANVHNLTAAANFVQCGLSVGSINGRTTIAAGTSTWDHISLQHAFNLAAPATVDLFCNPAAASEATHASLVVTTVSAIN